MEHVKDDTEGCDWSKLDQYAVKMAKTFNYTASMFGTFDFTPDANATQTVQKERKARRKADPAIEKRPTAVTQSSNAEKKMTKVDMVYEQIQSVSVTFVYGIFSI